MTDTYITQELFIAKIVLYNAILIGILIVVPIVYNLIKVYVPKFAVGTFKVIQRDVPLVVKGLFIFMSICFLVQPNKEGLTYLGVPMLVSSLIYCVISTIYNFNNIVDFRPKTGFTNAIRKITKYYSVFNWVKCCSCEDYVVREVLWEVDVSLTTGWVPFKTEFVCSKCAPKKKTLKQFFSPDEYFALKTSESRLDDERTERNKALDAKYGLTDDVYGCNWMKDM